MISIIQKKNVLKLQVTELIVHKEPALLDNFLDVSISSVEHQVCSSYESVDLLRSVFPLLPSNKYFLLFWQEMLAFQSDRAAEVKKFIITFIEEAW